MDQNFAGSALEWAKEQSAKGLETNTLAQRMRKDVVLELTEDDLTDTVDCICVVDNSPWTHERPLVHKERVAIPRKLALLMEEKGQVVVITAAEAPKRGPGRPKAEAA